MWRHPFHSFHSIRIVLNRRPVSVPVDVRGAHHSDRILSRMSVVGQLENLISTSESVIIFLGPWICRSPLFQSCCKWKTGCTYSTPSFFSRRLINVVLQVNAQRRFIVEFHLHVCTAGVAKYPRRPFLTRISNIGLPVSRYRKESPGGYSLYRCTTGNPKPLARQIGVWQSQLPLEAFGQGFQKRSMTK